VEVEDEEPSSAFEDAEVPAEEAPTGLQPPTPTFESEEAEIDLPEPAPETPELAPEPPTPEPTASPPLPIPHFGRRDPREKAQRLARVLISDIILYNPDRHQRAAAQGSLKEEFEDEIQKSWNEYVDQVGDEIANSTNFFNEALNEILAKGQDMF
jgi:hypothetical protein